MKHAGQARPPQPLNCLESDALAWVRSGPAIAALLARIAELAGTAQEQDLADVIAATLISRFSGRSIAGHHPAAGRLGRRQKLAGGGSGAWPCWIVKSVHDQNKTDYLAGNSFAE